MAVRISPLQILAFLVLAALAVSGWVYGLRWKRVALGDEPTQMEALLIDLQDQLDLMRADNETLAEKLRECERATSESSNPR
ncbi:MAG: hypothetical protein KDN19_06355 [Verrucomicrobiae bacterium]|nr:hypothetical protein [Verrucomicrobiae bacterium]